MKSKRMNNALLLAISVLFLQFVLSSYSTFSNAVSADPGEIVIRIDNLDPYIYGDIAKEFKNNSEFHIVSACVPVDLIYFEYVGQNSVTNQAMYNTIKEIIENVSDANLIELTDLDEDSFNQTCKAARHGTP